MASILLVDDEPDILATMQPFLEWKLGGAHVATARSGPLALEVLAKQAVDLVVTDFRMPGMDGAELTQRVRKGWPGVPIIMLTAYVDGVTLAEIERQAPGLHVMPKPVDLDAFLVRIEQALKTRPQ